MREKIGHYTIVSELGRGGMGIVYKAREESLNRFVAIKVLTERLTEDDTYLQRFVREARAAAGVSHPNIVQIFFVGEDQGHPYFVMEYVTGRSLSQMLREAGRIGNPRASQLILQAAHGLAAAHDHGIIHRDIKPANLILDDRGLVKIADFGLALPVAAETRLTNTGMLVGTPGYLAPEQCMGEAIDNRTDIYALGVTFYELLAGAPPFRGESPLALLRQILDEQPPEISTLNADVDDETRRILAKMIAKDRNQRYQSCHELVADLEMYLSGRGVRSATAGLATVRTPTAAASAAPSAASMAAPTQSLSVPAAPAVAAAAASAAPTMIVPSAEPATVPDGKFVEPPTLAPLSPPPPAAAQAVPNVPVAPPRRSSARALAIVAVLLLVVVGGGLGAGVVGFRAYRGWKGGQQEAKPLLTPSEPATTTGKSTAPQDGVLLAQGVDVPTLSDMTTGAPAAATSSPATTSAAPPAAVPAAVVAAARPIQAPATTAPVLARPTAAAAPPVAASRALSGVAVAVTGDQALVGPVSTILTSEIEEAVDAQTLTSTESLVRGGNASTARLIDRLRSEGFATLVLARVDPTGERELQYMGRSDTAYSARITLTAYDLATGRPIGSATKSTSIEYTTRTADRESEKIVGPLARAVGRALQER